MNTIPTNCHNCLNPLTADEISDIEADKRMADVVRYFGQAACNACCGKANRHNNGLRALRSIQA